MKTFKKAVLQTKPGEAYYLAAKALTTCDVEDAISFYKAREKLDSFNNAERAVESLSQYQKYNEGFPDAFVDDARALLRENPLRYHHDFTLATYQMAKESL